MFVGERKRKRERERERAFSQSSVNAYFFNFWDRP